MGFFLMIYLFNNINMVLESEDGGMTALQSQVNKYNNFVWHIYKNLLHNDYDKYNLPIHFSRILLQP